MDIAMVQSKRRNKVAMFLTCLVFGYALINQIIIIAVAGSSTRDVIQATVCLVFFIINAIGYHFTKNSDSNYKRVCLNLLSICYIIIMLCSFLDKPYIYVYVFPMFVVALLYADKIYMIGGAVCTCVVNLGCGIFLMKQEEFSGAIIMQVSVQTVLCVLACIAMYVIAKVQRQNNIEDQNVIKEGASKQKEIAEKVTELVGVLDRDFGLCKSYNENLNENMQANNFAVGNIASSTTSTAEAIQNQTTMTYDIQHNIESAASATKDMKESSDHTKAVLNDGNNMIQELKHQAKKVMDNSQTTKDTTNRLNSCISDVEMIIETILNISSQTNLLALNASIEAARAGEAGRGFSVVAEEIRMLSEETKDATNKITDIIKQLTIDANEATTSMESSVKSVEKQNDLIENTGDKFISISHDIDKLIDNVESLSELINVILNANTNISDSISQLSATSEEVSASSSEGMQLSNSAMASLENVNEIMDRMYNTTMDMKKIVE